MAGTTRSTRKSHIITTEEYIARLDAQVRAYLGISLAEFAARYNAGYYDDPDSDPHLMRLGFQLEFLQENGHMVM